MTGPRRLVFRIYLSFYLVFAVTLAATLLYTLLSLRPFLYRLRAEDLRRRALLIQPQVAPYFPGLGSAARSGAQSLARELGRRGGFRVTLILPDGTVIGDSEESPARMESHDRRPEVLRALQGETGVQVRYSATLQRDMLYVAVAVQRGGTIAGVLRVSLPRLTVEDALRGWRTLSLWAGLAALLAVAVLVWWFSRQVALPIQELAGSAERILGGKPPAGRVLATYAESHHLAEALERLAQLLAERSAAAAQQRSEEQAVLRSMTEGVLAVNPQKRVITINEAAARLLRVSEGDALGARVEEVVRLPALLSFIESTMSGEPSAPTEQTVTLYLDEPRSIRARATTLRGPRESIQGYLVVLDDITRLERLERLRSDFVANVSHELRTPITAIKGFTETLLDEGLEDREEALRFLGLVARETDRLGALVDDLLELARVEHEGERGELVLARGTLAPLLRRAAEACARKAAAAGVELRVECPEELEAALSPQLLERALVNLIDNAVKYSRRGGFVQITGERSDGEVVLSVRARGVGIAPDHLPRLFERFYRVDKARSRSLGGTGLGLAIVKHVALAHGGRVGVESTPGKGSVFSIYLPRP